MKKLVLTLSVGFLATMILVLMVENASAGPVLCNSRPSGTKITPLQKGAFAVCSYHRVSHVTTEEAVELAVDANERGAEKVCGTRPYVEVKQADVDCSIYLATVISYYTCK